MRASKFVDNKWWFFFIKPDFVSVIFRTLRQRQRISEGLSRPPTPYFCTAAAQAKPTPQPHRVIYLHYKGRLGTRTSKPTTAVNSQRRQKANPPRYNATMLQKTGHGVPRRSMFMLCYATLHLCASPSQSPLTCNSRYCCTASSERSVLSKMKTSPTPPRLSLSLSCAPPPPAAGEADRGVTSNKN